MTADQELTETDADAPVPGLPLSPQEETFVRAYADPESATYGRSEKSAQVAGYVQPRSAAWKLRRRLKIQARLAEFQAVTRAAAGKVLSDLEHTRLLALDKGDLATAARCAELAGKHIGMFYERNVLTVDSPGVYDAREAAEVRKITTLLLLNPSLLEAPPPGAEVPAVPAPGLLQEAPPARASAGGLAALESGRQPQAPQKRQKASDPDGMVL